MNEAWLTRGFGFSQERKLAISPWQQNTWHKSCFKWASMMQPQIGFLNKTILNKKTMASKLKHTSKIKHKMKKHTKLQPLEEILVNMLFFRVQLVEGH